MKMHRKLLEKAWNHRSLIVASSLVVITVLVVYWQDFLILVNEALRSDAASHIILIPFLFSYMIYRKKEVVKASLVFLWGRSKARMVSVSNIIGVIFCLTAFLVYWYGSYTFYPVEYHVASLLAFIIGVTLILTSVKTLLVLLFPVLFLGFLMPPPSIVVYTAGGLLASVNTQGSYALLNAIGLPVSLSHKYGAPVIALNTTAGITEFVVYQASSGLYSLIAFTMFATFLVYITRGTFSRKAALFATGILILPVLNIIRISTIVIVANLWGEEIAMNVFHTFTGWLLIFGGMLLLFLVGEKVLHLQILGGTKEKTPDCSKCRDSLNKQEGFCLHCGKFLDTSRVRVSNVFWMKAVALLICSSLIVISMQAPAFAFAPGLTVSGSNSQDSTGILPVVDDYRLQFLYRDVNYEKAAGQDASLVYAYLPQNSSTLPVYVIIGVANSISNLHNWEVSLVAWQTSRGLPPLVTTLDSGDVELTQNPRIMARYLVFQHPSNYTYVALYWYQKASFNTGLTVEPRYVRINLLILTLNQNESPQLITELETFGQSIALFWEPLRVQSLVSLSVPLQQFLLGSAIVAAVFLQTSQYAVEQRRKRTNMMIFEKMASPREKLLSQTVNEICKTTKDTTTQNIASAFEKVSGSAVKPDDLIEMLHNLEKHKLIRADVVSIRDEPKFVWNT